MKAAGAVTMLSVVAMMGLAFVHPFGNPRVEPLFRLDARIPERMHKRQSH